MGIIVLVGALFCLVLLETYATFRALRLLEYTNQVLHDRAREMDILIEKMKGKQ